MEQTTDKPIDKQNEQPSPAVVIHNRAIMPHKDPKVQPENTSAKDITTSSPSAAALHRTIAPLKPIAPPNQVKPTTDDNSKTAPASPPPAAPVKPKVASDNPAGPASKDAALQEATAKAIRRERELQEYITSRKYFVPINAAGRKRSIKISFGLVFMLFILSAVLIDLLLDSGIILLLQKIPHTHFFDIG